MGGAYKDKSLRGLAVLLFWYFQCNPAAATAAFLASRPDHGLAAPHKFVERSGNAFPHRWTLDTLPKSGAKRKIPPTAVDKCATAFVAGLRDEHGDKMRGFASMHEAALFSPTIHAALQDYGVTYRMVERRPGLMKMALRVERELSKAEQQAHLETAQHHLRALNEDPGFLDTVIFLDKCHAYMVPDLLKVWVDKFEYDVLFECKHLRRKSVKLEWYLAVNAKVGLLSVVFVTGTTGKGRDYLVSAGFLQVGKAGLVPHAQKPFGVCNELAWWLTAAPLQCMLNILPAVPQLTIPVVQN